MKMISQLKCELFVLIRFILLVQIFEDIVASTTLNYAETVDISLLEKYPSKQNFKASFDENNEEKTVEKVANTPNPSDGESFTIAFPENADVPSHRLTRSVMESKKRRNSRSSKSFFMQKNVKTRAASSHLRLSSTDDSLFREEYSFLSSPSSEDDSPPPSSFANILLAGVVPHSSDALSYNYQTDVISPSPTTIATFEHIEKPSLKPTEKSNEFLFLSEYSYISQRPSKNVSSPPSRVPDLVPNVYVSYSSDMFQSGVFLTNTPTISPTDIKMTPSKAPSSHPYESIEPSNFPSKIKKFLTISTGQPSVVTKDTFNPASFSYPLEYTDTESFPSVSKDVQSRKPSMKPTVFPSESNDDFWKNKFSFDQNLSPPPSRDPDTLTLSPSLSLDKSKNSSSQNDFEELSPPPTIPSIYPGSLSLPSLLSPQSLAPSNDIFTSGQSLEKLSSSPPSKTSQEFVNMTEAIPQWEFFQNIKSNENNASTSTKEEGQPNMIEQNVSSDPTNFQSSNIANISNAITSNKLDMVATIQLPSLEDAFEDGFPNSQAIELEHRIFDESSSSSTLHPINFVFGSLLFLFL